MDLGRYIHQLLKHRKEVYVKGLGVFKRMHTPSVYDERKGMYLPPVTYLEFDAKGANGADFVEYFQQNSQLSRSEAELEVESAVLEILDHIKNDGVARLTHVGQLVRHGTSLVFKAEDLGGFQLQPIAAAPVSPIPETSAQSPADLEESESPETESLVTEDEGKDVEEEVEHGHNRSKWYLWVAVVAAVVIAGLFYINRNQQDGSLPDQSEVPEMDSSTSALLSDSTALDAVEAEGKTDSNQVEQPLIPPDHSYQIVIGTHNTLAQAYEQAESFNKAGIASVRVIPSKLASNKKRVIWDTYETKVEADSALRYVRRYHVSDAWHQKINQ